MTLSLICLISSVLILVLSVISAICKTRRASGGRRLLSPFYTLAAGTFVSSALIFVPVYYDYFSGSVIRILQTALLSIHNAIRLFVIDSDFEGIEGVASTLGTLPGTVYSLLGSILFLLAPVLTFGFVLSFFRNLSSYFRLYTVGLRDLYVFSALNEKSLALATNIRNSAGKKAVIVFADAHDSDDAQSAELLDGAAQLGAICFNKNVNDIRFRRLSKARSLSFFAMSEDESENISCALGLIDRYGAQKNSSAYVFATSAASEMILASKTCKRMKLRRVNSLRALVERTLYDNGGLLFDEAKPCADGSRLISALIVGSGKYGREMVKSLTWLCQMDGYRVEFNVFDSDPLAGSRFTALCPELMDEAYNGVYRDGEAQYKINYFPGVDVNTIEFARAVKSLRQTTYAFVALGDDDTNVRVASSLRVLFEQMGIKPRIQTVVYDSAKADALRSACNFSGQPYSIDYIGDLMSFYSEKVIINSELEREGLARHLKWGKEEDFWRYEYNYHSSIASAIHMKMRIHCRIPGADKKGSEQTAAEQDAIAVIEHRRWNAYMRSEGYVYSGSPDKSSRNNLGKMHHDLVNQSLLSDEDINKDKNVGSL